jgi:hypothetical protein
MARFCAAGICLLAFASFPRAESEQPLLIRHPTVSRDTIALVILDQLKKNPVPTYKRPEYPNYRQALPK